MEIAPTATAARAPANWNGIRLPVPMVGPATGCAPHLALRVSEPFAAMDFAKEQSGATTGTIAPRTGARPIAKWSRAAPPQVVPRGVATP